MEIGRGIDSKKDKKIVFIKKSGKNCWQKVEKHEKK